MQVNRVQTNNSPSFKAKLHIIDNAYNIRGDKFFLKDEIKRLRDAATKVGTHEDKIYIKLGNYEFGETKEWAEQGSGWFSETEPDFLPISVKSIINNKKLQSYFGFSGNILEITDNAMKELTEYFTKLATSNN